MKPYPPLFFVLICLLLAGCSLHELDPPQSSDPLLFRVDDAVWGATRGASFTDQHLRAIRIAGYHLAEIDGSTPSFPSATISNSTSKYFDHTITRTSSSASWSYAPIQFWPASGTLSFIGYTQISSDASQMGTENPQLDFDTAGDFTLTFEQPQPATEQHDLLATALYNLPSPYQQAIPLHMEHLLAQLQFAVRNRYALDSETTIQIYALRVQYKEAVKRGGTYHSNSHQGALKSDTAPFWSLDAGKTFTSFLATPLLPAEIDEAFESISDPIPLEGGIFQLNQYNWSSVQRLNAAAGNLFMIPQSVATGDLMVTISYTIESGSYTEQHTKQVPLPAPSNNEWRIGANYIYQFTLSEAEPEVTIINSLPVENWWGQAVRMQMQLTTDTTKNINALLYCINTLALIAKESHMPQKSRFEVVPEGKMTSSFTLDLRSFDFTHENQETESMFKGSELIFDFEQLVSEWHSNSTFTVMVCDRHWMSATVGRRDSDGITIIDQKPIDKTEDDFIVTIPDEEGRKVIIFLKSDSYEPQ